MYDYKDIVDISKGISTVKLGNYIAEESTRDSVILNSPIIYSNAEMNANRSRDNGVAVEVPMWNIVEGKYGSMAEHKAAPMFSVDSQKMTSIRHFKDTSGGATDLSGIINLSDPYQYMVSQCARIQREAHEDMVYATIEGAFNAPEMKDRTLDITQKSPAPADGKKVSLKASDGSDISNKINPEFTLNACDLLGDRSRIIKNLIVHSRVYRNLKSQNFTAFIPMSRSEVAFNTYLNLNIIVTDQCPKTKDENGNDVFTSYLMGDSVIGFSTGGCPGLRTFEVYRDELVANTVFVSRWCTVVHPMGFSWQGSIATPTPENDVIRNGASWRLAFKDKRNIPMIRILSNG